MKVLTLLLIILYKHPTLVQGTINVGPDNVTYYSGVTPLPIELTCNVTGVAAWRVNDTDYTLARLTNGALPGHSRNGTNILVNGPVNNTEYICVSTTNDGETISDPAYVITIAGVPEVVPGVKVDIRSVNIDMNNVTLTLNWGEPFNNLDPILNYIVSCSGDITCPPNFTTTDITRNHTITNLATVTTYTFSVVATNSIGSGEAGVLNYTTPDVPEMVPNLTVDDNTININGNIVTLTLNWGELVNNLDPIVNYIVSCSDDLTCPPNFTTVTTDNTTRSYTITNLATMTTYTFSVVATNSFGNGQASVLNYTTPAIDQVTGVNVICEPEDQINKCDVMWNPITQENITGYQVCYNGTIDNSTSTSLSFTAPSPPNNVFTGTVVVMVAATNRYGIGPASEPKTAVINASSVTNVTLSRFSFPDNTSEPYNVTFNCTIHPDSTADHCEVRARANDRVTRVVNALIINGMATVIVNGLECGVTYTILAGGTLNGDLVGPRIFVVIINTTDSCEESTMTVDHGDDDDDDEGISIGGIVGGIVGGVSGVLGGVVGGVIFYRYRKNKKNSVTDEENPEKGDTKQKKDKQMKSAKKSKDKDTLKQQLQDDKADSPEAKNEAEVKQPSQDVYAVVNKDKGDSAKAKQTGQLTYADLEIQKGPNRSGNDGYAVEYGQVAETKQ